MHRAMFANVLLLGSCLAQSITVAAPAPTTLFASVGATQQTTTVAQGALPPSATQNAFAGSTLPNARTILSWDAAAWPTGATFTASAVLRVMPGGPAQATLTSGGLEIALVTPLAAMGRIRIEKAIVVSAGAQAPSLRVDIGNDAIVEVDEASPPLVQDVRPLGTTPLVIRIDIGGALTGPGSIDVQLQIHVDPEVATTVTPLLPGCNSTVLDVVPTFDGDLSYSVSPSFPTVLPSVVVFGGAWQPVILSQSLSPCLLLPAPDVLVLTMPYVLQTLSLPPSLRPVTFTMQAVDIWPELQTTAAYRVTAL